MIAVIGDEVERAAHAKEAARAGGTVTRPDVLDGLGVAGCIKAEELTTDAITLCREIEDATSQGEVAGAGRTTGVDIDQLRRALAIDDAVELSALRRITRKEQLALQISEVINVIDTRHPADRASGWINREQRAVGAIIRVTVGAEIETAIGIDQAVNAGLATTAQPRNRKPLQFTIAGGQPVQATALHAIIGGEVEKTAHVGELTGRGGEGVAIDVGGQVGAGGRAVALPELAAFAAIVVAEVERAADDEQIADAREITRLRQQGLQINALALQIESPEIPLSLIGVTAQKGAQWRAVVEAATAPETGIVAGIINQTLVGISGRNDLEIADAVALIVDVLIDR